MEATEEPTQATWMTRIPDPLRLRVEAYAERHGITRTAALAHIQITGLDVVEAKDRRADREENQRNQTPTGVAEDVD